MRDPAFYRVLEQFIQWKERRRGYVSQRIYWNSRLLSWQSIISRSRVDRRKQYGVSAMDQHSPRTISFEIRA